MKILSRCFASGPLVRNNEGSRLEVSLLFIAYYVFKTPQQAILNRTIVRNT